MRLIGLVAILVMIALLYNPFPLLTTIVSTAEIQKLNNSPLLYQNRDIIIFGKVVAIKGPLNIPVYRVADKTGDIWVIYDDKQPPPDLGTYIILQGQVEELNILGKTLGVVVGEKKRLYASSTPSPAQNSGTNTIPANNPVK